MAVRVEKAVYIIDDDSAVRRSLELLLRAAGYSCVAYDTPMAFLQAIPRLSEGCILLDERMPEMSGLEVQARLASLGNTIPVIVMTGQGNVQMAVRAMKAGAIDFIEKPFDEHTLLDAVSRALAAPCSVHRDRAAAEAARRLAALSHREREVLDALALGHQNKVIAFDLGISVRTVEVHRARMMQRLGVRHLAEAIRLAVIGGTAGHHAEAHRSLRGLEGGGSSI